MDLQEFRDLCLSMKGASEDMPFDEKTLVIRVGHKMFALISLDSTPPRVNLKCDPFKAQEWRDMFPSIIPGYHMNKRHWNSVYLDGKLSDNFIREMVDESYRRVFALLSKRSKKEISEGS